MFSIEENLFDFAFCPMPAFAYLSELAVPEDWGENDRVLKNYLTFTFKRAVHLYNKAAEAGEGCSALIFQHDCCLMDTGLFTERFEPIYVLFEPNERPDARQQWFLKGFYKASDPRLIEFSVLPDRVHFSENPADFVFDYRLEVRTNIDHILGDAENLSRIPEQLKGEGKAFLLRHAFEGAVMEASRRAAANYTIAVPQYYNGRIQLLLPLCLTGDTPELALTIQREDGYYSARTCLTLDMAYNNARLICRPEAPWIKDAACPDVCDD